jgi:O-antigen ligase
LAGGNVVDDRQRSAIHIWLDTLPAVLILCWTLAAPVSIAVSQVFVGLAFAAVVVRLIASRFRTGFFTQNRLLLAGIGFWLLSQLPSVFFSPDSAVSWRGLGESDWLILLCLTVVWTEPSERWVVWWFRGLGLSCSIAAVYAIWQHFQGWDLVRDEALIGMGVFFRGEGFLGFYLTFAGVQLAVFGVLVAVLVSKLSVKVRWYWILVSVLVGMSLWVTYARGAWMGAAIGLLVLGYGTGGWKRGLIWLGTMIGVAVIVVLLVPEIGGRIGSLLQLGDSGRGALWRGALLMVGDQPLTGIGIGRFQEVFPRVYNGSVYVDSYCHAHSDPLNRLAETGVIGVMGAMLLWGILGWMGWRVWRVKQSNRCVIAGRGAAIGLLMLWVAGWSQCYYTDAEVGAVWWFMVGLLGVGYNSVVQSRGRGT